MSADITELTARMEGSIEALKKEFSGLRTGRASANLLDSVQVEAYGSMMPLNQVGSVSVPEPRTLNVKVFDTGQMKAVEKAITNAGLGLNPSADGDVIRIPIPDLTEERRVELTRIAKKYTEDGKISIRNTRRDGMDTLKKQEKDGDISKDDHKRQADDIQKLTDDYCSKADVLLADKEKEIMAV